MSVVTTVRGDIGPEELGFTSMHEHLNADLSLMSALPDDYDRAKGLIELLRAGFGGQIVLGHDTTTKPNGKSYGYYGFTRFLPPLLAKAGLGDDAYRRLVIDNPARILAHPK